MEWEEDQNKINFIFPIILLESYPAKKKKNHSTGRKLGDDLRQSLILKKRPLGQKKKKK